MEGSNRQPGIERRVSLAQCDDGLFFFGNRLDVRPKLQSGLQAWFHASRYWISDLNLLLSCAINANVVG